MKARFRSVVELGHKGCAVIVPFDPAEKWKSEPTKIFSPVYGKEMPGHPVSGTIAGKRFSGWIGHRWGRHFLLVDEDLRTAAGVAVGEEVDVEIAPTATAKRTGGRGAAKKRRVRDA